MYYRMVLLIMMRFLVSQKQLWGELARFSYFIHLLQVGSFYHPGHYCMATDVRIPIEPCYFHFMVFWLFPSEAFPIFTITERSFVSIECDMHTNTYLRSTQISMEDGINTPHISHNTPHISQNTVR